MLDVPEIVNTSPTTGTGENAVERDMAIVLNPVAPEEV